MSEVRIAQETTRGKRRYVMEESRSHPGLFHTVDLEHEFCSCPATVRCWHIEKHLCAYCLGYGTRDPRVTYPRLVPCSDCNGTGLVS